MDNASKFPIPLPVGMDVLWYKNGDMSVDPIPAKVLKGYDDGTCDLILLYLPGVGAERKLSVYPRGSSVLFDPYGRRTGAAMLYGCWDFNYKSEEEYERYVQEKLGNENKGKKRGPGRPRKNDIETDAESPGEAKAS